MSLFRQLWLTVILVTLISFTGSFVVSMLSTQSYLEQQLHRKNIDSANALAHSISQLNKDPATIAMQIDAVFNSGQYETISITSPEGNVVAERSAGQTDRVAPEWFMELFPINAEAGSAQILDSWMHFGIIKVAGNPSLAYKALWNQAADLIIWFLAAGISFGLLGMLILQRINKPLAAMVSQAEAIAERRFLTISEPRIPELRSIARATNDMIRRLHNRALEEASRLEELHQQIYHDPVTGLANREYFMKAIPEILGTDDTVSGEGTGGAGRQETHETQGGAEGENVTVGNEEVVAGEKGNTVPKKEAVPVSRSEHSSGHGFLFIIRLNDLEEMNLKLGRDRANGVLRRMGLLIGNIGSDGLDKVSGESAGKTLNGTSVVPSEASGKASEATWHLAARLNGSDFALVMPGIDDGPAFARRLTKELASLPSKIGEDFGALFHIGAVRYQRGDKLGNIFALADTALAAAQRAGGNAWHVIAPPQSRSAAPVANIGDWREIFREAFVEDRIKLVFFPVAGQNRAPLHKEAYVRMQAQRNGGWLEASDFVNIAARLDLTGPLDLTVIRHALEALQSGTDSLAVNLSVETILDWDYRNTLVDLLHRHAELCPRLWIEVPESGAFRKFEAFRDFCHTFAELGCRTGIEQFGHRGGEFEKLRGLGLHYLKVEAGFVRGVNHNMNNQRFLKGLCGLADAQGILPIADGVQTEAERKTLIKLGFKGVAGPGVK